MRISDWSSDVCSSDLPAHRLDRVAHQVQHHLLHLDAIDGDGRQAVGIKLAQLDRASRRDEQSSGRRSEERRVGKECVRPCRSRWSPEPYTKKLSAESVN